ncbi:unnamed protein product [Arabidopsis thaliana]|jgi:ribonuclease-3 family protein|uniref:RNase III domain-containing protein n=3 Tax=Arabidopsis TaxID=3701 RepID=A0A654EIK2_ARATH|nr:Ribonuclease III family protein [Arabidopsis thaliana]KAG7657554.1 Ribonuclease III domain [Arabidopsis suecica]AAQ62445.1 At1g55140 [Arabidopsis thaliana]AEE33190.1 Ribonuclease III family protein [Arabidopsis thaliana]CAA0296113.1 unnamed protein product [Arabidopsis thaliana]VYS49156.1 unnamed protein product [Arabidopsis thaliana]|eukprot:NP_175910.2 Ribonuclease III family protein [Arabidopsis thaliana]
MAILSASSTIVRAALDTQPKLRYNPNAPRNVKKNSNLSSFVPPSSPSSSSPATNLSVSVSDLLKRPASKDIGDGFDDTCVGYEKWFPSPPKVEKPRSVFNAASLAYIGDSIYEIYARRHFLFPPLSIEEYNDRVRAVVRCEAQYALLQKLVDDDFLTKDERDILRWGKNVGSVKTRSTRRAGVAVYNKASSLETLIGYLYLSNGKRLEEMMQKLGFSSGSSTERMVKEAGSNKPSFK